MQTIKQIIQISFLLLLLGQTATAQETENFGNKEEKTCVFVLRLMPGSGSSTVQVGILRKTEQKVTLLPLNSWVRQVLGHEESPANPQRENLVAKYNVFPVPKEAQNQGEGEINYYNEKKLSTIIGNLWRVRYSEYPFMNPAMQTEKGWARHPDSKITWLPSEQQMTVLRGYGIKELSDYFIEEEAFRLLKDVRDKSWQNTYRGYAAPEPPPPPKTGNQTDAIQRVLQGN
ncbi:MAG: hypothetical protein CSB06_00420 [Bacteroidia bacterium]|nr:MAG: hypothetical protein CSB06_00420 [Bacteroidia bacterium]